VTLHINESEVEKLFTMAMAIEAVEKISQRQAAGEVLVHPRRRFELPEGAFFHNMAAADVAGEFCGDQAVHLRPRKTEVPGVLMVERKRRTADADRSGQIGTNEDRRGFGCG